MSAFKRGGVFRPDRSPNKVNFEEVRDNRGNDPDFLFYNAQIINNSTETTSTKNDPAIVFQDTRTMPLLLDKSKYAVSVENFTLNGAGKNLPLFIPQIREFNSDGSTNTNPNNTVYDITFTVQYGGTKENPIFAYSSQRSIQWIPENQAVWTTQPDPVGVYQYPQPEIDYYYCFTYSHWVKLVNNALALAWNDVTNAALKGSFPGITLVINSLNGKFVKGDSVKTATKAAPLTILGTATVVSFSGDTLVLYNITGSFNAGNLVFTDTTATAAITTVSDGQSVTPGIVLGTKCPFYTYDSKTNLFSLWQDSNTCVTPFGFPVSSGPFSPANPPSALDVFGASSASGYLFGEYSFVGYNTNFDSIFTNFDTTYYSDNVKYPRPGVEGAFITSPTGLETVEQNTVVNVDSATIATFSGNTLTVTWTGSPVSIAGSDWTFGYSLTSDAAPTTSGGSNYSWKIVGSPVAGFLKVGMLLSAISASTSLTGTIVSYTAGTLILTLPSAPSAETTWVFSIPPIISTTQATPTAGVLLDLQINQEATQIVLSTGKAVSVSSESQSFDATVSSVQETFTYTGATSANDQFTYSNPSSEPGQFNPLVSFQAQDGLFLKDNVIIGQTSSAQGKIISAEGANSGTTNTITIKDQTQAFAVGQTLTDTTTNTATAVIESITGPNSPTSVIRTGILELESIVYTGGNYYYSGPFNTGDQIVNNANNSTATITKIEGDNGYMTLNYSALKNPLVIGTTLDCYASLVNAGSAGNPLITSGTIKEIIGDNTGYGTMNFTNQSGKFGVGESIVDNVTGAVATIVAIQGDNNGYGYVSYINQQAASSAPSSFTPGEFLLYPDGPEGIAFAQVVLDKQNVINQTEGNIGTVTCVIGQEIGGVFYATANVPIPPPGARILGSESGTAADIGAVAYTDSGVLIVNNICGSFNVGDLMVDTAGFGLPTTTYTNQSTAVCNGVSYLDTGKIVLKNTNGGASQPPLYPTGSFIIDVGTAGTTNPIVLQVSQIAANSIFYIGNQVTGSSSGAVGVISANNGPYPYGSTDPTVQLLTVEPANGSAAFQQGETLTDSTPGTYLTIPIQTQNGVFGVGQLISGNTSGQSAQIVNVLPAFPAIPTQIEIDIISGGSFTSGETITNQASVLNLSTDCLSYYSDSGGDPVNNYVFVTADLTKNTVYISEMFSAGQEVKNWNTGETAICNWSAQPQIFTFASTSGQFTVGDIVQGLTSKKYGKVIQGSANSTAYLVVLVYNGSLVNGEGLTNLTNPSGNGSLISHLTYCPYSAGGSYADVQMTSTSAAFTYSVGDAIGILPYQDVNDGTAPYVTATTTLVANHNIVPSGANVTVTMNNATPIVFAIGDTISFYAITYVGTGVPSDLGYTSTTNVGTATGKVLTVSTAGNQVTMDVAFTSFRAERVNDSGFKTTNPGISAGIYTQTIFKTCHCVVTYANDGPPSRSSSGYYSLNDQNYVSAINFYTNGMLATNATSSSQATLAITNQITGTGVTGLIENVITSSSSAFVQTCTPPQQTTLTVTNVVGSGFSTQDLLYDVTNGTNPWTYATVQQATDTTNYAGGYTDLTVKSIIGTFNVGDTVDNGTMGSATVQNVRLSNGYLIVQQLSGTFTANEILIDLGTFTTATYLSSQRQTITDTQNAATAQVDSDNGTQIVLSGVSGGTFRVGNSIVSDLGYTAVLSGTYNFAPNDQLSQGSASAVVVSDNGSEVIVTDVSGQWTTGTFTDNTNSVTANLTTIGNTVLVLVPSSSVSTSDYWSIIPAALKSSSTVQPPSDTSFTTNLTATQSIFSANDTLTIDDVENVLTVEQLYYPENVVQVDISAGNYSVQTLQSLFPSSVSGTQYVVLAQDFESTSTLWSPVASIVIATSFITVREEYSGTPITIGTGNLGGNATTGSFQKVLLETPIDVLPQTSWKGLLQYRPQVETLSSLGLSKEDLKNLDVQVLWRNRLTNSLTPLTLYNGGSANVRLMFKRIHE